MIQALGSFSQALQVDESSDQCFDRPASGYFLVPFPSFSNRWPVIGARLARAPSRGRQGFLRPGLW